jgi:hypothetical protein
VKEISYLKITRISNEQIAEDKRTRQQSKDEQFEIQKKDWDLIKDSKNINDFYTFLEKYPNGFITEQATFAIEKLSSSKVLPQISKNGEKVVENKVRFRVGDTQVNRVTDINTGVALWTGQLTVEKISEKNVYIKVGTRSEAEVYTLDGGVVKGTSTEGTYSWDPPRVDLPGDELSVGKKWTSRTIETVEKLGIKGLREDQTSIEAFENITVPAGTFKAFKVVMNSSYSNGASVKRTYWVEPGWGFSLKIIREVRRPSGNNQFQLFEMMSRSKGV